MTAELVSNFGLVLKLLTAIGALAATLVTLFKVFEFRTERDKQAEVGRQFAEVVEALASENPVRRAAGAILLRRFFDPGTESGDANTPYSREALGVIASMLRTEKTGVCQKLLADSLAYAPALDLRNADLQGTNLYDAYLGDRVREAIDISGADFFKADLSKASLNGAVAEGAVFYQAVMTGARLERARLSRANFAEATLYDVRFGGADLRGADFAGADLTGARFAALEREGEEPLPANLEGARFERATLTDAVFAGAVGVPDAVARHLDDDGIYRAPDDDGSETDGG